MNKPKYEIGQTIAFDNMNYITVFDVVKYIIFDNKKQSFKYLTCAGNSVLEAKARLCSI